ncbi:hypothetical protein ATCC90586_002102 [Pythium insidiosum]|nr:hypothetical protein ATCC90586_002102 [Pythium insidiosum]
MMQPVEIPTDAEPSALAATTSRAAFLSTGTADYRPPDWACMPIEANMHARLDAFRESRHCATYMLATKRVNVFGRDQESCDHVLGNPSVSRKHAAVIHDASGGIYLVDLMSRHGTYVNRKKLPPHDPHLLHEGDIVKFGQSIRVYVLKGASAEGTSAPVKKTWGRVKLKAPKVSISAVLPKMNARPKYAAHVAKLVSDTCYGHLNEEKTEAFITAVLELGDDERKDAADLLVEKIHAKYELYAAHIHRNAYELTATMLKRNLLVDEFEANLAIITQLSQQRHDSIYRANARKLLQLLAAVRLDPENVHSPVGSYSVNDSDSVVSADDSVPACPPTSNHAGGRERVLSGEGKRLFLAGHADGSGVPTQGNDEDDYSNGHDDNHEDDGPGGYEPPMAATLSSWRPPRPQAYNPPTNAEHNGGYHPRNDAAPASASSSAFTFMANAPSTTPKAGPSAFGFIAAAQPNDEHDGDDDDGTTSRTSSTGRRSGAGFDFMQNGGAHVTAPAVPLPRVRFEDFLASYTNIERDEFDEMWESTTESEEWAVELTSSFNQTDLLACLEESRIKCVSIDKVSGMQQLLLCAEQQSKGTVFLVEIMLMPGLSDATITFKCIVNSLLYENGHELFVELFKHIVHPFCTESNPQDDDARSMRTVSDPPAYRSSKGTRATLHDLHMSSSRSFDAHADTVDEDEGEEEEEAWDMIPVLDYLSENATIDPARFEQLWAGAQVIGSVSSGLGAIPIKDDVIATFHSHRLSCLASGSVNHLEKFYFFGEMVELHCLFCVEVVIDAEARAVTGTIKRFAFQSRIPEEEEQIDASFVHYMEQLVQQL